MEVVFIRHGEPAWSLDGVSQIDPHLTERGRRQARLVADRLADGYLRPTEILVSPLARAWETAAPLAERTGIAPQVVAELEEIRMPDWSGELEERVQEMFAAARQRAPEEWWEGIPGGETFHAFHHRVTETMASVLAARGVDLDQDDPRLWRTDDERRRLAVVAHAGTNSVAISYLLGIAPTPWEWERFILGHASLARVRTVPLAKRHVFSLRVFNDREHLPPELRTR